MIILVTGCPCSGKTSVCRELEKYGFRVVSADQFFPLGKDKYDTDESRRAYARLFSSLGSGDYAVDAPGNAAAFLQQKKKLAYYTTVKLEAPWETILERYQSRWQANDIPPWKLKKEYEDAGRLRADVIVNTGSLSPADAARVVMQRMRRLEHDGDAIAKELFGGRLL